jgi:serine/threonine protein kinase
MSDLTGKTVAGYPIEKLLAKGSYADTYQVSTSGAPMAAKIIQPGLRGDGAANTAMAKGWELSRAAVHASLITAFGANVDNDVGAYCLQELVRGKSLREILMDGSKMAWRDFIIIGEQLLSGIQALHKAGVLHGDIWTGSIQITQDQDLKLEGAGGLMYVPRRSVELLNGPSMSYQAPEVLRGSPISVESDLYAVGGCLYAVLAGHDPYPPESAERLAQIVSERKLPSVTALREDFPPATDEFLTRLMAKDPTQRYAQAADALADLMRLKEGKPLAPLKGGKPAASPLPSSAATSTSAAPASRPKSSIGDAVGSRPPSAGRSGFGSAIGAKKPISGLGAAVGSSGSKLQSIKEGSTTGRIFGRLDTHVKSTIPQTDLEKRGDDLYRQGQLPLALNCWREAYENSPHTGLKVKVDLAERDVKRDAYSNALEEARMRLDDGDFAGAIARAREALLGAEDEQQRREVLNVERDAIEKLEKERYTNRVKMIGGGVALLILAIISLIYLTRKSAESAPAPENPVAPPPAPVATTPEPSRSSQVYRFKFESAKATVGYTAPWSPQGNVLVYLAGGQRATVLTAGKLPGSMTNIDVMKQLRVGKMFKEPKVLEDNDYAFTIEGNHWVSKLVLRYSGDDGEHLHYYFVVGAPTGVCLAESDGLEEQMTSDVREQIQRVITTWRYEK